MHVAQIVVRVPAPGDAAARTQAQSRANAIYARLVGGEDFAALARTESDDPLTGQRGGDLGPVQAGQIDAQFFAAVEALKPGELSKPFVTSFGVHVVKALEAPRTVEPSFAEVRGRLAAQARQEAAAALREKLRSEIRVKRYPDRLEQPGSGSEDGGSQR